jgi:hypothetical protein
MYENKKISSRRIKSGLILLPYLLGVGTGLIGARLFPEPIYTETFHVFGTNHVGQKIRRFLGPDEILMYSLGHYRSIPLDDYLIKISERDYERNHLKEKIIESAEKTKIIEIN